MTPPAPARAARLHALLVLAALGAGSALRALNLGGPAFSIDEFYHAFAARRLLAGEGLTLPTGEPYSRARLVTLLTAGAFAVFGESEAAARLPALLFGVLTLLATYGVGRALFGRTAGLAALALLAVSPHAIDIDRFTRFYSPLTCFGLVAAFAAFRALEGARGESGPRVGRRRAWWGVLAGAALVAAAHLQPVALALGLVVQAYALAMALARACAGRPAEARRYGALAALLVLLEAALLALPGVRAALVQGALAPLPWYRPVPGDAWLYHRHLAEQYAWLWYLVWPATVVAVVVRPRAGLFVALAFWVPFVLWSAVVATKAPRYVSYLLPFAWLLLGAATGALWVPARDAIARRLEGVLPAGVPRRLVAPALVAVAVVPVARLTPSVAAALARPRLTVGSVTVGDYHDWHTLARALGPQLPPDARLVASTWFGPWYYLDRPVSRLVGPDHPLGHRDGRIQRAADLAALRATGAPVWVVVRRWRWETPGETDAGLKRMVAEACRGVPLPQGLPFVAFACDPPAGRRDARRAGAPQRAGRALDARRRPAP